jgi:hypothetical protein
VKDIARTVCKDRGPRVDNSIGVLRRRPSYITSEFGVWKNNDHIKMEEEWASYHSLIRVRVRHEADTCVLRCWQR